MLRNFSRFSRLSSVLPSTTTSTSNSVEGKRLVTSSYCLYSTESERNNWLSESSILIRWMPNAAPMHSSARMMHASTGARMPISPIRSSPNAMLGSFLPGLWASRSLPFTSCMRCPFSAGGPAPGSTVDDGRSHLKHEIKSRRRGLAGLCDPASTGCLRLAPVGLPKRTFSRNCHQSASSGLAKRKPVTPPAPRLPGVSANSRRRWSRHARRYART